MNRRFSKEELYLLRNNIPIELLIEQTLKIPSKNNQGIFRFLCPSCNDFFTSVNYKNNLAKCFSCKKNFNTIEIVIEVRKIPFVQAVKFLQKNYDNLCPKDAISVQSLQRCDMDICHYSVNKAKSKRKNPETVVPISEIIPGLLHKVPHNGRTQKNNFPDITHPVLNKLDEIEQNLKKLAQEIKQIKDYLKN